MKYECGENMSAKEGEQQINLQNFKNSKAIWLTLLTGSFIKPSCKLL